MSERLRSAALKERARLDELRAAGLPLDHPRVLLIDDIPVYGKDPEGDARSRRGGGYFVLVAAEVYRGNSTMIRVARAFPRSNIAGWRVVFKELGYEPDFVVADAGTGQLAAVRARFPNTVFVPSVWHVEQAIRNSLAKVAAAHIVTDNGKDIDRDCCMSR